MIRTTTHNGGICIGPGGKCAVGGACTELAGGLI
jgi:hypothetical protein